MYSYFDVEKTDRVKKWKVRTILFYLLPTNPLCESHRPFEERITMTKVPKETCKEHLYKEKKFRHYHTNHFFLHRQFRYLAWAVVCVGIVALAFLSYWFSQDKKDVNSIEWLFTVLLMASISILVVEPMKIAVTAYFATYIVQVEPMDFDMERGYPLLPELGTLHTERVLTLRRALQDYAPVTTWYIPELRAREKSRLNYQTKSYEIAFVLLFALAVFCAVYYNIDERHTLYMHHKHLQHMFLHGHNESKELNEVRITKDIYDYVEKTFIPLFMANKSEVSDLLFDEVNQLIGEARLRQLRVKRETKCPGLPAQDLLSCISQFTMETSDNKTYYMGWSDINPPAEQYSERAREQYWKYRNHFETRSIPIQGANYVYPGGGYVATLGRYTMNMNLTLQFLKRNNWLDEFTSFVVLEALLYDMNNGYLTFVNVIFEKDVTGYLLIDNNFRTVNLNKYPAMELLVLEIFFGLLLCGIVYYQLLALQSSPVKRHFDNWWSIYDILMAFVSVASISLYLIRRAKIVQMFYRIDRYDLNQYMSLAEVYLVNEFFLRIIAILVFLVTIRMVKACMNLFCFRTLEVTLYIEIMAVIFISVYAVLVLMACSVTAWIGLGYRYEAFQTPVSGFGTVTAQLFGVSQNTFSIYEVWFIKMLFGFIVALSIIIVNMYRAVLLEAYTKAKSKVKISFYGFIDFFKEESKYHCKCRRRLRKMKTRRLRAGADVDDGDAQGLEARSDPTTQVEEAEYSSGTGPRWNSLARNKRNPFYSTHADSDKNSSAQKETMKHDEGKRRSVENLRNVVQTENKKDKEIRKRVIVRKTVVPLLSQLKREMQETALVFDVQRRKMEGF